MRTNFEIVGQEWTRLYGMYHVEEWRQGWLGLWDSLKAVVWPRRWERPRPLKTYTVSLYVKTDKAPPESYVFGGQIESS